MGSPPFYGWLPVIIGTNKPIFASGSEPIISRPAMTLEKEQTLNITTGYA
jgi:hypothetical protein